MFVCVLGMGVGGGGFHEVGRSKEVSEILVLRNLGSSGPSRVKGLGAGEHLLGALGLSDPGCPPSGQYMCVLLQ